MKTMEREIKDWFNPVLVKELRQFLHRRVVLGLVALLLIGQLTVMLVVHLVYASALEVENLGQPTFSGIISVLQICVFLLCVLNLGQGFQQERQNPELDFFMLTALSPARIIWGKLSSALAMLLFIHLLCLPFAIIAYFLRGISVLFMLQTVLLLLPTNLALISMAILVGTTGKKNLIGLLVFGGVIFGMNLLTMIVDSHKKGNFELGMSEWLAMVLIPIFWSGFCYVLSLASISHSRANRILPVRVYLLGMLVVSPAAIAALAPATGTALVDLLKISFAITAALAVILLALLAACERPRPSLRLQRQCPKNIFLRSGFFLLSSGSGGGILLAILILLLLLVLPSPLSELYLESSKAWWYFTDIAIYTLFYASLAIFLQEIFPKLSGLAWLCLILVFLLLLPSCIAIFVAATESYNLDYLTITTPFYKLSEGMEDSGGWPGFLGRHTLPFAAAAVLLASLSVFRQWQALTEKNTETEQPPLTLC